MACAQKGQLSTGQNMEYTVEAINGGCESSEDSIVRRFLTLNAMVLRDYQLIFCMVDFVHLIIRIRDSQAHS